MRPTQARMVQRSMAASPLGGGGNDTRLRQVTDRSGNCRGAACCAPTSTTLGRDRPRSRRVLLRPQRRTPCRRDRKSTRLNSSHLGISYAVFCLKKKKKENTRR